MITVVLAVAALTPLWWFPRAATQDGPSHLYNTTILLQWNDPGSPFPKVFDRDLTPGPNWLGTAVLWLLLHGLEPATADKVLLTLCVAGTAAAWWFWMASVRGRPGPLVVMGPLIGLTFFLFKGFHGFCLGVPLFLLAAGWAWRIRERVTAPRAALLHALLALTWLAHMVPFGMALIAAALILVVGAGRRGAGEVSVSGPRRSFLRDDAWRRALWLSPAYLLALSSLATASGGATGRRWGWGRILLYVARGEWLVFAGAWQMIVGCGVMLLLAALAVRRLIPRGRLGAHEPEPTAGSLLLAAGAAWALCLVLPRAAGGGDFLTDRLAMYPVLLLAPLLDVPEGAPARWRAGVMACLAALTIAQAGFTWDLQARANIQLAQYLSLPVDPDRGSVVLPLAWEEPGPWRISPLRHAGCLYTLRAGAINLADYEARTGYFQVRFREPVDRAARVPFLPPLHVIEQDPSSLDLRPLAGFVDYLITWNLRSGAPPGLMARYLETWDIAAESGRVILFRRRTS